MFDRLKSRRLYNKAVSRIILPDLDGGPVSVCSKRDKRNPSIIKKLSLSFAMVIAIICAGTFVVSVLNGFNRHAMVDNAPKHSFTLVAYAAEDASASPSGSSFNKSGTAFGATLRPNVSIRLPHGKIFGENEVYSSVNNSTFVCSGKDIASVTFTASEGNLYYLDLDKIIRKICTIDLTDNEAFLSGYAQNTNIGEVFKSLWDKGEFDNYKKRYFAGMSTDLDNYYLISNITYGDGKPLKNTMDIAYKTEVPKTGKSITVKSGQEIHWSPSEEILRMLAANTILDFSELKKDDITITAKFTDGQTLTKTVVLSFDNAGYLCAKLLE
jgi:hypothetical protein